MFLALIIIASTLLHLYLYWRLRSIPWIQQRIPVKILRGVLLAFWSVSIVAHPLSHYDIGSIASVLDWIGMHWIGSLFILFSTLLLTDIVTGFGRFLPRLAPRLRSTALILGFALIALAMIQGYRAPEVEEVNLQLANLPSEANGLRIVFLSDLHIGDTLDGDWLSKRIDQVQALNPDLIFLGGDLIEGHGTAESHRDLLPVFRRLKATHGVYMVIGNHERHLAVDEGLKLFEDAGFHILRDSWMQAAQGVVVAGIDDSTVRVAKDSGTDPFSKILANRPDNVMTMLLSHRPDLVEQAAQAGADIMFSGHTHNGQIWPFGEIVRLIFPYLAGQYRIGEMTLFVSRGAGTWGPRMRLWRPGQILSVQLVGNPSS